MFICCRCGLEKPKRKFPRDKYKKRKYAYRCKECENLRQREARKQKPEIWEKQRLKNFKEQRMRKGIPLNVPRLTNPKWKGKGYIDKKGYRILSRTRHPFVNTKDHHIREHVLVMSEFLGRKLRKGETVHHKNGIRDDNRLENLELWSSSHPKGQRVEDKVAWCIDFLLQYGYSVKKENAHVEPICNRPDCS